VCLPRLARLVTHNTSYLSMMVRWVQSKRLGAVKPGTNASMLNA